MTNGGPPRPTQVQPRRRTARMRVLMAGFFVLIGLVVVLESPLMRVRRLTVEGNTSIPAQRLISDSGLEPGMSLWQVNRQAVTASILSREPFVESVSVNINILHRTITLVVKEKSFAAVYAANGTFYRLLDDGTVYDQIDSRTGLSTPVITSDPAGSVTIGKVVPNPYVPALCKQLSGVAPASLVSLSEIHVDQTGIATLFLDNRFEAQCRVQDVAAVLPKLNEAVAYFVGKGYPPGLIDMTGGPPYQYTPFQTNGKGGSP